MYRWYGADECGDGHWNMSGHDLGDRQAARPVAVFPDDDDGKFTYVDRYRPGSQDTDQQGRQRQAAQGRARDLLPNTASGDPELEDDPATAGWITITSGWQLLDDRLGIEVTVENPDEWHTGAGQRTDGAQTDPDHPRHHLDATPTRPTTALHAPADDGDRGRPADPDDRGPAKKRTASPTQFARERSADGKDHFQYCTISRARSITRRRRTRTAPADGTNPLVVPRRHQGRQDARRAAPGRA